MTDDLKKAEMAAHAYDGLGSPMYRPHIADLRRQVIGPNFNGVVLAVPERWSCEPMLAATREDALSEIAESNEAATEEVFNASSEGDDE